MVGLLVAGVFLSFGILIFLIDWEGRSFLLSYDRDRSALLANDIVREVRELMVIEKRPTVIRQMVNGHNLPGEIQAALFKADGTLYAGETNQRVPADIFSSPRETSFWEGEHLIFFAPLLNEKRCQQCHQQNSKILGVVMVDVSTSKIYAVIREVRWGMIMFGLLVAVIGSGGLILILRKMVLVPVVALREATDKIVSGDLQHRITLDSKDEFSILASSFNHMAESMETSIISLDRAVQERTNELEVVATLSIEVFRGDRPFALSIELFLEAIIDRLGFGYASVCFVDKKTGLSSLKFDKGSQGSLCHPDMSLTGDHPLARVILEAKPVVMNAGDLNASMADLKMAVIPIISHQRKHCREINLCHNKDCPAYGSTDERCWLINGTLCRSPQSLEGKLKIFGCMHCSAFPVYGVLMAATQDISDSTLNSLEILSAEISSAWENQILIDQKKQDIENLIRLHDLSIQRMTTLDMPSLINFIVSSIIPFANMQAALLWINLEDGLHFSGSFLSDGTTPGKGDIPDVMPIDSSLIGRSITERRSIESVRPGEMPLLDDFINKHGFKYAVCLPLIFIEDIQGCICLFKKTDLIMTDAEKAVIALFTHQASAAIHAVSLYNDLLSSKNFSEAIFESTASGIMVISQNGHILKVNSTGAHILGRRVEEMVGENITALHPEMSVLLFLDESFGQEVLIKTADNRTIPIGSRSSLLPGARDRDDALVLLFRDLSEIKKLQAELREKEHFETMGKVVAGVAHEVRNPLFGISSIGQILERENENPQHRPLISAMLKECERMKNLIEELLLYTRQSHLDIREIDLGLLLMELEYHVKGEKGAIDIKVDIPPSLTISADRNKITHVLLNILNNAIEAARTCVTVTAYPAEDYTKIIIRDDGPGITQKNLERIFEPFFTTKKGGTGLGLPICKKLTEDHQGSIEITSQQGKGTEVVLLLKS
jgi:PAS domain S-box-containing protein